MLIVLESFTGNGRVRDVHRFGAISQATVGYTMFVV